ncbi:hypothetical protein BU26DRAFT_566468 [Trematosphaeria pertusa]|uniref:Uncharacterized protein n=1 Tax=Trematosphaeria pertusa TaxID=390896 RepID=A0A6A6IAA8_9PLEO|nr:uncharacterized protein BU26DRAFT_566468 [Trematosphaeria pertusa]KAF2247495.1 hypothetical protein BU26DRAFT_566468 [Trematosphaeria pertusa]
MASPTSAANEASGDSEPASNAPVNAARSSPDSAVRGLVDSAPSPSPLMFGIADTPHQQQLPADTQNACYGEDSTSDNSIANDTASSFGRVGALSAFAIHPRCRRN